MYFEAPNYPKHGDIKDWQRTIFLAGSITGAADWQKNAADKLLPYFTVFNPRRANYDVLIPNAEREQINWEHTHLNLSSIILFYFSYETLGPISLLELGALLEQSKITPWKKLYIAIHPEYKRKNDVVIQTELRNPKWRRNISFSLEETLEKIIKENR